MLGKALLSKRQIPEVCRVWPSWGQARGRGCSTVRYTWAQSAGIVLRSAPAQQAVRMNMLLCGLNSGLCLNG